MTTTYSTPRLRSMYSKLVELNRLEEVLGMTMSSSSGRSSSMTSACHEPFGTKIPETL